MNMGAVKIRGSLDEMKFLCISGNIQNPMIKGATWTTRTKQNQNVIKWRHEKSNRSNCPFKEFFLILKGKRPTNWAKRKNGTRSFKTHILLLQNINYQYTNTFMALHTKIIIIFKVTKRKHTSLIHSSVLASRHALPPGTMPAVLFKCYRINLRKLFSLFHPMMMWSSMQNERRWTKTAWDCKRISEIRSRK